MWLSQKDYYFEFGSQSFLSRKKSHQIEHDVLIKKEFRRIFIKKKKNKQNNKRQRQRKAEEKKNSYKSPALVMKLLLAKHQICHKQGNLRLI